MENNVTIIENCLDELLSKTLSEEKAKEILSSNGVEDPAAMIRQHREAVATVQRYKVLQQVQQVHNAYVQQRKQNEPVVQPSSAKVVRMQAVKWTMRVAAVLVVAAGIGLGYMYSTNDGEKLYGELYSPYNVVIERASQDDPSNKIVSLYETKDNRGVIAIFEQQTSSTIREQFFAAMAYNELGEYNKSSGVFENILAKNKEKSSRLYNDEAEYYLGLTYLKQKKYTNAYTLLKTIKDDPNHTYHQSISKWLLLRLQWLK
jgi:tetratricopeptide (TPR) repeat protein